MRVLVSGLFLAILVVLQAGGAAAQTTCPGGSRIGSLSGDGWIFITSDADTRACTNGFNPATPTQPTNGFVVQTTFNPAQSTFRVSMSALVNGANAFAQFECGAGVVGTTSPTFVLPLGRYTCTVSYADANGRTVTGQFDVYAGADPVNATGYRHDLAAFSMDGGNYDRTDPTPTLAWAQNVMTGAQTVTLDFDEPVTGFALSDLTLNNLIASAPMGSGDSYSFTVTPVADGAVSVQLGADMVVDGNNNGNLASNLLSGRADLLAPTLEISGLPPSFVDATPIVVTFAFSEDVTGFALGDIAVSGGSVANLQGGPAVYTATVTPSGVADLSISVAAGAAQDGVLRDSGAAQASAALDTAAIGSEANARFMLNRANQLLANQPDLSGLLRGDAGHFNAEITSGQGMVDFYSGGAGPFWADVAASWSTSGTAEDTYILGTFGAHRRFGDNLLAGVMLELDYMEEVDGLAEISGWGWLVGPYLVAKLPDQPLYFDARLLYGQSYNQASPLGSYTDDFTTQRWLAMVNVSGDIALGWGTLSPQLNAAWTQDRQREYVDGASNTVAAQTVSLTQIAAGAKLDVPLGALALRFGADAVWSASGSSLGLIPAFEGLRGRLRMGADYALPSGGALSLALSYDGLGTADYQAIGVSAALNLPF